MKITEIIDEEYADATKKDGEQIALTKTSKTFQEIHKLYLFWLEDSYADWGFDPWSCFYAEKMLTENRKEELYSMEDITNFCFAIKKFEEHKKFKESGAFLSALINVHYEKTKSSKEYILVTEHLQIPLDELCSYTKGANILVQGNGGTNACNQIKKGRIHFTGSVGRSLCSCTTGGTVIIDGDCENNACFGMEETNLLIKGNAGNSIGYSTSKKGKIIVNGNVGKYAGHFCYGGKIHIKGDAEEEAGSQMVEGVLRIDGTCGKNVGSKMQGGKIFLNEYESISGDIKKGKIYCKNKQIYPQTILDRIWQHIRKE